MVEKLSVYGQEMVEYRVYHMMVECDITSKFRPSRNMNDVKNSNPQNTLPDGAFHHVQWLISPWRQWGAHKSVWFFRMQLDMKIRSGEHRG